MTGPATRVAIKPTRPAGPALRFELIGEDQLSGGIGGWQVLPRPRREDAVEWVGTPGQTYVLPLLLDGIETTLGRDSVVEPSIRVLESWGARTKKTGEPPILSLAGPLQVQPTSRWTLNDLERGPLIRNSAGRIVQQQFTLTLLKYVEATIVRGHAAASRNRRR